MGPIFDEATADHSGVSGVDAAPSAVSPLQRPNFSGDLGVILTSPPVFRRALHGYDRLQIDNYVAWAEGRLAVADREVEDLIGRCGRLHAELGVCHRQMGHSRERQELTALSERIGSLLALAADEASRITATATAEAERISTEARAESEARLRKAEQIKDHTTSTAHGLLQDAQRERDAATASRQQATAEAEHTLAEAISQRQRLDAEADQRRKALDEKAGQNRERAAAEADDRIRAAKEESRRQQETQAQAAARKLAATEAEIQELERQCARANEALDRMRDHACQALAVLADLPDPATGSVLAVGTMHLVGVINQ